MNDSSLIWVHWLKYNWLSCLLNLVGNSSCKILQSLLAASAVIFCIKLHPDIIGLALVYNKACKVLQGVKGLSSLTDQDSHILSFKCNLKASVICVVFGSDLHFAKIHGCKYIAKECNCSVLNVFNLSRIGDDLNRLGLLWLLFSWHFFFYRFFFCRTFFKIFLFCRARLFFLCIFKRFWLFRLFYRSFFFHHLTLLSRLLSFCKSLRWLFIVLFFNRINLNSIYDFLYFILFRNSIDLACFDNCRFASDTKKSGTTFRNHFNIQLITGHT